MSVLSSVKQHIVDAGLDAGYTWRFGRIRVEDMASSTPYILVRQTGEGVSNVLLQQFDVLVAVFGTSDTDPASIPTVDAVVDDMVRLFRLNGTQPDVVRFEVLSGKAGPFAAENDKPYFEFNVRVFREDG